MILSSDKVQKIAVFRALQLGDMLCAVPAIKALRNAYPAAEIVLLGLPWASTFVQRFSMYFDRFIHFPGYPGLPEQQFDAAKFNAFTEQMRDEEFDLLIQMQGNGTIVNPLMLTLGAKHVAGFFNEQSVVHSSLFMEYPDYGPEADRHLLLMQHLGIASCGNHLEFPLLPADYKELDELMLPVQKKKYVCVHPGSRGSWRQWPPKYFAALADYCVEQGFTVIVTGTNDEIEITKEVIKCMQHPAIDLTGKTKLGAVGLLIKDAYLLIANCTGVSHIAAATETPSIIISMDGEPERWGPVNKRIHTTIDWTKNHHFETVFEATVDKIASTLLHKKVNQPA